MPDHEDEIEVRLTVLETLVAFLFAAQHMQTADPAGAITRLKSLLVERVDERLPAVARDRRQVILAELERSVKRITDLQEQLPRRLVD